MAIDPISAGLGAVSLLSGKQAQKKADKRRDAAQESEAQMAARAAKLFDVIMGNVDRADAGGLFDPEKRFAEMRKTLDRENDMDSVQLAGDLRIAGGKPGERASMNRLAGLRANQSEGLSRIKDQVTQESFFNKLSAYQAANPQSLLGAAGIYGRQADRAAGMGPNPGGFFESVMPFMNGGGGTSRRPTTVQGGGGDGSDGGYGQDSVRGGRRRIPVDYGRVTWGRAA